LITALGTRTTPDGAWRISASEASLDLSRSAVDHGEGWTSSGWSTDSWQDWRAHPGWFVFIESNSKAWAYDGDRALTLVSYSKWSGTNSSATIYSSPRFPFAVPAEVYSRLSEPAQKAIETHE
jgi:hypothetical protein